MTRRLFATTLGVALGIACAVTATTALASRNSSGTYTLPTGNPVVSGTAISTTWANTTLSDIASNLTSSLDRTGKGGMQAPLACTDGSVSFPSLTFVNETTTGLYRIGSNDVGLSIGGVKRWEHTTAGQIETGWLDVIGTTALRGAAAFQGTTAHTGAATFSSTIGITGATTGTTATFDSLTLGTLSVAHAATFMDPITIGTPTAAMHAATKAYVDAAAVTVNATNGTDWAGTVRVAKRSGIVTVTFDGVSATVGTASWGSIATLPVGYRPGAGIGFLGRCYDASPGADHFCQFSINTSGVLSANVYDAGTSNSTMFSLATGDAAYGSVTFVAEN